MGGDSLTTCLLNVESDLLQSYRAQTPSQHRYRAFPKIPIFHVGLGRNDRLVKMEWQQATIDLLLRFYDCGIPKQWGERSDCLEYASKEGHIRRTVHEQTHKMPEDKGY